MLLNISNIQHFSVGDGAGIRTTVFFKGCNLVCPWCHNPENLSEEAVTLHYANGKTEQRGQRVTPEEILPELLEDKDFYEQSGGGVTFSGGEVMLQADGASTLAAQLHEHGVSVLIDTAGCVPYTAFETLNRTVDGYLLDLKTADEAAYRAIGGDLALLVDNIRHLQNDGVPFTIRIPLIPDFNTDDTSLTAIGKLLFELHVSSCDVLPFHRLGSAKYTAMGLPYAYSDCEPLTAAQLSHIKDILSAYINVRIER